MILYDAFPGGKENAFTLSYDDGDLRDVRLMELFRKYDLKATFHLVNSVFKSATPAEIGARYAGFEISVHGKCHKTLTILPCTSVAEEIGDNRRALEAAARYPVTGMSYANGGYNDTVIAQLRSMGIVYARTTRSTHKFSLPDDFMQWHPTCHHRDALTDADAFLGSFDGYFSTPRLFYVWGHSHELRCEADWAHMEQLCEKIAHNDRIWYATNMEIYRYLTAQRSLVPAADESFVYNPTHTDVWIRKDGAPVCIRAGETHFF